MTTPAVVSALTSPADSLGFASTFTITNGPAPNPIIVTSSNPEVLEAELVDTTLTLIPGSAALASVGTVVTVTVTSAGLEPPTTVFGVTIGAPTPAITFSQFKAV